MKLASIVIDSSNAEELSEFYRKLLDWNKKVYNHDEEGEWIVLSKNDESTTRLVFQQIENYVKPLWPSELGKQQVMEHVDFYSDNIEESVENAIMCGAKLADNQYGDWKVLLMIRQSLFV